MTINRGIDVGAAVILESGDGKILLTRRGDHLHTFPGIWVPPGKPLFTRAKLLKTNDVVSKRDVKFSNIFYMKILSFLQKKCEELLQCKSSSQFFSKKYIGN